MKLLLVFLILKLLVVAEAIKFSSDLIMKIARYNILSCYGISVSSDDICSSGYYTCELIEGTDDIYTITAIDFSRPTQIGGWCYVENFFIYSNLTTIYAGDEYGKIRGNGEALLNVGKLTKIKKVFYKYVEDYNPNAIISDSLEELYIGTSEDEIPLYFFETGSLKSLTIESAPSYPKMSIPNLTLKNLKLGVTPSNFNNDVSDSYSKLLVNLQNLELVYNTSGTISSSDAPVLKYYQHLKTLKIKGGLQATNWDFLPLHSNTQSSLESLTLTNSILKFTNGYDFSSYSSGFKLIVNGYTSSFSSCSKCLKFPINTIIESYGNLEFASIDFTNVTSITSSENDIYQPLPELLDISINYKYLKSFHLTDSEIYGTIPESYCQLPNDFSLSGNQLSYLPKCFRCDLTLESKLFPNGYYLASRDCSDFSLTQVTLTTDSFLTSGGGTILFMGNNLGWQYTFDSQIYELDIPNKEFAISISKGVGKNIQKQLTLNNDKNQTITYSYAAPNVTNHKVMDINGKSVLVFYGTGFDFENINVASIKEIDTEKSITHYFDSQDEINNYITSSLDDVYSSISSNKSYQVIFTVGNQESNAYEFKIIKSTSEGSNNSNSESNNNSTDISSDYTQSSSKLYMLFNLNIVIILILIF